MFRRLNVARAVGLLAVAVVVLSLTNANAFAGWGRCCTYYYYVPCEPEHPDPEPVRQVRVTYFSNHYSAWFDTDAVVPQHAAVVGASAVVSVPRIGSVRGWIVSVYSQPRTNAQPGGAGGAGTTNAANPKVEVPVAQRSSVTGYVRLWTNKAGTKTAFGELLQIRDNSVLLRDGSGQIHEQAFASLSDADVAFLRAGSIPASHLVSVQR